MRSWRHIASHISQTLLELDRAYLHLEALESEQAEPLDDLKKWIIKIYRKLDGLHGALLAKIEEEGIHEE